MSAEDLVVTDDSGPIGLGGVMGGETTEMSATTTSVLVEAAHWDPVSMFRTGKRHRLTSEAGKRNERGVDPLLPSARRRPGRRAARRRTAAARVDAGRHPGRHAAAPADDPDRLRPARPGDRHADRRGHHRRAPRGSRLHARQGRHRGDRDARPWRPDLTDPYDLVEEVARVVGYAEVPSVLPTAPAGARPDPRAAPASPGRPHPRGRRLRRGDQLPVRRRRGVRRPRACPQTTCVRHTVRLANPLSHEEPAYTTTLLPGLIKAAARNIGRGAPGVALFETGTVAFPADRGPAPIYGVDWRPTTTSWPSCSRRIPDQPLHLAVVLAGERERAGWWGEGREAGWADAIGAGPAARRGAGRRRRGAPRSPDALAPGPLRPARGSAGRSSATPASCTREVCQAFGLPPRSAAVEIDLDLLLRLPSTSSPGRSSRPTRWPRRTSRSSSTSRCPSPTSRRRCARARVSCWSRSGSSTSTPATRSVPGKKSLAFALRFRAPDRTLTEEETSAARDAAVALAAERTGAVQR